MLHRSGHEHHSQSAVDTCSETHENTHMFQQHVTLEVANVIINTNNKAEP